MAEGETERTFTLEVDGSGVGRVTVDRPGPRPNLLDRRSMEELDELIGQLESRVANGMVAAVVIRSARSDSFIAGADVSEISELRGLDEARAASREGQRIFRRLERLSVPTIAVVEARCLGGGTELILACEHRIAAESGTTEIGLPETRLGIIPGFGGTVRLPRRCGIQNALELILSGKSVSTRRAEEIGLVDHTFPPAEAESAISRFVEAARSGEAPRAEPRTSLFDRLLEETAPGRKLLFHLARRRTLRRTEGNYPAPLRALEVIERTHGMPIDRALEIEAEALAELALTAESRNLVRLFLLRRAARSALPGETLEERRPVDRIAVLGAGVMGGEIAELAAAHDLSVLLKDIETEPLESGIAHARGLLEKAARKGVIDEDEVGPKLDRIEGTLDYDDFGDVDLVVEAVIEKMAVKREVLRETEEATPETAVFTTNTSSLSVTELAEASSRPGRVLGLHFFNPVHRMPLVEVVRTDETEDAALATVFGFALDVGKTPVLVRDGPGFLVNRLLAPYLNEAGHLLEEGVEVERVDRVLSEFGMPMGPFRLLDEVGLDIAAHVAEQMERAFGERMTPARVVSRLVEDGRLGKKNGLGFYVYEDGEARGVDRETRAMAGEDRPDLSSAEIRRRCLFPMVNEAAHALEEELVASAGDVDLAMIMGTGFPPFRGGPLRWADRLGIPLVAETLEDLAERHGARFRPAPSLVEMAARQATFTDPEPV